MRTWRERARDDAREILQEALRAVAPQVVMRRVRREDDDLVLPDGARVRLAGRAVRLIAIGKAAGGMAAQAQAWGPFVDAMVSAPHPVDIPGFASFVGGHPTPNDESVLAGARALDLARATRPDDLLIVLLSGGASALCEAPRIPLGDLARTTKLILESGAPIDDVNAIRVALSRVKGGGLARACRGELVTLAVSDVDEPATLGSGPTLAPPRASDPARIARERGLLDALPRNVRELLAEPQREDALRPSRFVVLADNTTALDAAAAAAARLGYAPTVLRGWLQGEARDRGAELGALAREPRDRPHALLVGGETVVRVLGSGKGGRNQELALAAVDAISGWQALLATLGTDGVDGPTDAAGAIVDGFTRARADALGLDAQASLAENDAYAYFDALDDLVRTGPTGTNVRDLALLLVAGP